MVDAWGFGTNDALTVKLWGKRVQAAERDYLEIDPLIGDDDNAVIKEAEKVGGDAGDEETMQLRKRLLGDGFTEDQPSEGNGEPLSFFPFKFRVNELLHLTPMPGKDSISQKRVVFGIRDQGKDALAEWHAERASQAFFNQVCGFTPQTDLRRTGLNAVTAPSSGRILRAGGVANDESLSSGNPFVLDLLDQAATDINTGNNRMRPIRVGGKKKFICYLHDGQVESLRTSAGNAKWREIQLAALQGGKENHIYDGAIGEYNDFILRKSQDVTLGVRSDTGLAKTAVRRAVILGASAAAYAQKTLSNGQKVKWYEKEFDSGRKLEMSAMKICGMKKVVYDGADYGTYVISTYSRV